MKSCCKKISYAATLLLGLAACDKPASFLQPLGPQGAAEPDPRLFGAWQLTETSLSEEWGMVEVEVETYFDGKGTTTQGSSNTTLVATLHIVPGKDSEVVVLGSVQQLTITYMENEITAGGDFNSSWLALSGYPTRVKDAIYFNLKPVGGKSQGLDIISDWGRIGHEDAGYFIAKVELVNENTLEIRPVMTSALMQVFKTIETGEDGKETETWDVPVSDIHCGWNCNFSVNAPPFEKMAEVLEANAAIDEIPTYRFQRLTSSENSQP